MIEEVYKLLDEDGIGYVSYINLVAFYVILLRLGIERIQDEFWGSLDRFLKRVQAHEGILSLRFFKYYFVAKKLDSP